MSNKISSTIAQVGDTVQLTIIVTGVVDNYHGSMRVQGRVLDDTDRTYEILSRATLPLPIEPGTWWLDAVGDVWGVNAAGKLFYPPDEKQQPERCAPFRQLVLKC